VYAVLAHSAGAVATVYALARLGLTARRLIFVAPGPDLDDYAQLFRRILGFTPEVLTLLRRNIEAGYDVCWQDFQPSRLAPSMSVPLTVFHDRDDKEVSLTEARRLVESWAGAELVTTRGLGHRRILDNPWVVAQAAQRLRAHGREPASI
jgi:pimeloyl-ACP methyl ester carboxylesterase